MYDSYVDDFDDEYNDCVAADDHVAVVAAADDDCEHDERDDDAKVDE